MKVITKVYKLFESIAIAPFVILTSIYIYYQIHKHTNPIEFELMEDESFLFDEMKEYIQKIFITFLPLHFRIAVTVTFWITMMVHCM